MKLAQCPSRISVAVLMALSLPACSDLSLPAQGALGGAAAGGVLGALVSNNRAAGAAIGAGVGGLLGAGAGYALQGSRDGYADREQDLQQQIAVARQDADALDVEAAKARASADRMATTVAALQGRLGVVQAGTVRSSSALRQAQADRNAARDALARGEQALQQARAQAGRLKSSGADVSALEAEAVRMQRSNNLLRDSLRRMDEDLGQVEI